MFVSWCRLFHRDIESNLPHRGSGREAASLTSRAGNYRHEILRVQRSSSMYRARREDREGGFKVRTLSRPFDYIGGRLVEDVGILPRA